MDFRECIVCSEKSELFGISECGHSDVCARCHFKMRTKQQNIVCVVCRESSVQLFVSQKQDSVFPKILDQYPRYDQGHIYFENNYTRKLFEEIVGAKCKFCQDNTIYMDGDLFDQHLRSSHGRYLW
jgi:hypothetical protein